MVQLVDAGSFTKAARDLHVSQPALSVSIAKLERELHAPLLVRGARPLTLTPAGELAYAAGKEIIVKTSNLRVLLAELAQQEIAVAIGMIDSVAAALFVSAESADELERQASVSLVVDNSRNLVGAVEKGSLDLAFVVGRRQYGPLLEITHQAVEPMVVVCHAAQRPETNRALRAGTLSRFISYDQASNTHRLIADVLQSRGIVPTPTFYSTSPELMLRLVLLQKGVAALPYALVRDHLAVGELVLVGKPTLLIERPINAIKRRDTVLPTPLAHITRQVGVLLDGIHADARTAQSRRHERNA